MTLELPSDVAVKIMGMLQPTERPLAVLCVYSVETGNSRMFGRLRAGTVTDEERVLLQLKHNDDGFWRTVYLFGTKDLVHMALALGFSFRGEADRARWQAGEAFELYRDAVRSLR
jgi:hypothetical protein